MEKMEKQIHSAINALSYINMFVTAMENMKRGKERLKLIQKNLREYEKQRKRVEKTLKDIISCSRKEEIRLRGISSYGFTDSPLKLFTNAMKKESTGAEKLKYTKHNLEEIKKHVERLDKDFKRLKRHYGKKA